jgi:ABC-type cobalamin/Fe3+-siderophores transport systems, ATPase components
MDTVCTVRNLYFRYGREPVLEDVSFTAAQGEIVALAGPNGSGKTSLLRVLAGLERAERGTVRLFDQDVRDFAPKERARRIAYVPQLSQEEAPFTVRQITSLGRAPWQNSLGMETAQDQEIVRESMRYADVESLADRPLCRLSGGERQRVGVARALCQRPELFLLDEPTAALDYGHQIMVMDMLDALRRERKIAIILVSHDVNLAAMYADRLLLIRAGRVVAYGSPADVLTRDQVASVYSCSMLVDRNPCTHTPRVSPLPKGISG